ncbi:hypothetical protein [Corynebacterium mayonis]|uniref:hypothetical protein n=1 Tax=Corynebacterium mayonis TaxID=3062461 RepID=UPI003140629A
MTAPIGATAAPTIEYHPDAPRPSFVWAAQLPLNWRYVDTHPAKWRTCAERLADDYLPGVRLSSPQKKTVKAQLEQTIAQAQNAGVLVVLILPGLEGEDASAATLLLRWVDSSPSPASVIATQRQMQAHNPIVERTGRGESYVFVSKTGLVGPVTDRRTSYTHQAFLPVAGTNWTLVVSGSAPSEETGAAIASVVRRLVSSVRTYADTAGQRVIEPAASGEDVESVEGVVVLMGAEGSVK